MVLGVDWGKVANEAGAVLCGYVEPWDAPCHKPRPCADHGEKRCHCGAPAMRGCDTSGSWAVCGFPLCASCKCARAGCR